MSSSAIEINAVTAESAISRFYSLLVRSVRRETRDSIVVTFDIPPDLEEIFRFIQGQYVTLRTTIDGAEVRRSYSICSAVQDRELKVGIKRTPGGLFSNWAIDHLNPGDRIDVMAPEGRFHIPLSLAHAKHYVAFAAGSGITPVFSIIKTTLLSEPTSKFTLFYGNRASSTVMLREELADLKDRFLDRFSLIHVMTREHQDSDLLNGRITGEKATALLRCFCPAGTLDYVFLCGPQQMMSDITAVLKSLGLPESRIKMELFVVAESDPSEQRRFSAAERSAEHQIKLIVDGRELHFTMQRDESILDAALRRGIDLRHSCKSGVCATCRAKLIEGQVDMDAHYALEDYEVARGFILTCQSYPVTDQVTIDFDQDN